jgi:hypothetical protein
VTTDRPWLFFCEAKGCQEAATLFVRDGDSLICLSCAHDRIRGRPYFGSGVNRGKPTPLRKVERPASPPPNPVEEDDEWK